MENCDIMAKVGSIAFLVGIFIALVFGIWHAYTLESEAVPFFTTSEGGTVAWILAALGAIIGFLTIMGKGTITAKEVPVYLIAAIALVVMGGVFNNNAVFGLDPYLGSLFSGISLSLSIFVAPTVGILSVVAIWAVGKDV